MVKNHAAALALLDELADHGVRVELTTEGKVDTFGDVPDALGARLRALVGEGLQRETFPPHRALRAVLAAPSHGLRELLTLPVALAALPVVYAVTFARKGACAVFTTSSAIYKREGGRLPVFVLRELVSAAQAFEQGRAGPSHLDEWLAAKARGRMWLLTPQIADVLPGAPDPLCTFGELFDGLGAELVGLEVGEST